MLDLGKKNLLGVGIDVVDYDSAVARILSAAEKGQALGASALAVHGVMTGVLDPYHRHRLNHLELVVPDGQPVRWGLNWLHRVGLRDRVYGPDLMLRICAAAAHRGIRIGLFGGQPELLSALQTNLRQAFPDLRIVAAIPSRFRQLAAEEKVDLIAEIHAHQVQLLFVGLGCPRQEVWAYEFKEGLQLPVVAVGAAFNFHAGWLSQAPKWMQRSGLEWLYRLLREPGRLWKRYLFLNPSYLCLLACQKFGWRSFRIETTTAPEEELRYG